MKFIGYIVNKYLVHYIQVFVGDKWFSMEDVSLLPRAQRRGPFRANQRESIARQNGILFKSIPVTERSDDICSLCLLP